MLFVQSSAEVGPVARARAAFEALGARVLVATPEAIDLCNDKAAMHAALAGTAGAAARDARAGDLDEFVAGAASASATPTVPVCFKPPVSKGSRGFRILRPDVDRAAIILRERPNSVVMTLDESVAAVPRPRALPAPARHGVRRGARAHRRRARRRTARSSSHQTKTREAIDTGLAMAFRTVERPDLVGFAREACRALGLDWFVNLQFKGDKLLEVNPRVSTFVYQEDFILPYLGIKYALGELDDESLAAAQARVRTSRRTLRYHEQLFWDER